MNHGGSIIGASVCDLEGRGHPTGDLLRTPITGGVPEASTLIAANYGRVPFAQLKIKLMPRVVHRSNVPEQD